MTLQTSPSPKQYAARDVDVLSARCKGDSATVESPAVSKGYAMTIRSPIEIIRALLASRGVDDSTAEEIIDAIEANGWYFVHRCR